MIDTIALIVPLEQASAHQFRYRPAHIRLARSPYLLTDGVVDDRGGLIDVGWYYARHCLISPYPFFQYNTAGVTLTHRGQRISKPVTPRNETTALADGKHHM